MSFTTTYSPTKNSTNTASIYLKSPSKRKRIETFGDHEVAQLHPGHSTKQIYSWTFRSEAVASCHVKHCFSMKEEKAENYDFYWLGSVPCRTVKIVGLVVGVVVKENKVIYSVDDGTAVIDCTHMHKAPQPPPADTLSKYRAPVEPPKVLVPLVGVGGFLQVQGRVRPLHESRHIIVDDLVVRSMNDELYHKQDVRNLYKTVYSRKEPFVIPEPPPATPKKKPAPVVNEAPSSPSTDLASSPIKPQSSPISSPVKSVVSDSPCSSLRSPAKPLTQSPVKLRHPSRLNSRDLTDNTFRIYVKHYMSYAPVMEEDDDDLPQESMTPTKRRRTAEDTPRQSTYQHEGGFATPRPRIEPINFGIKTKMPPPLAPKADSSSSTAAELKGFTLSYLRRVPELSHLASRVVEAVARRHYREERKKLKELRGGSSSSSRSKVSSSTSSSSSGVLPPSKFAEKKKRLFKWAVIELLNEGGIALWDGPVRRCPSTRAGVGESSRLWKASTSASMTSDSSLFGNTTTNTTTSNLTLSQQNLEDEEAREYLSDPPSSSSSHAEESYVPLTPPYLASPVENAISVLVAHYTSIGRPYAGATKEGILSVLRKDDRWRFVGDWSVEETLEWLNDKGRVWKMSGGGGGRWDLTA